MATKPAKHGACLSHEKLPCGCKVCVTPNSTAHNDRPALVEFHADIHAIQAARALRPRLPGDGMEYDYEVHEDRSVTYKRVPLQSYSPFGPFTHHPEIYQRSRFTGAVAA